MTETARWRYCIPEELLQRIDVIAQRRGVCRNRMVLAWFERKTAHCPLVCAPAADILQRMPRSATTFSYEDLLQLKRNHPAWRLLSADHAPLVTAFLDRAFREDNRRFLPESDLVMLLDDFLYTLRQTEGPEAFPRDAADYLTEWAHHDRGWLRKFYPPGSDEAHFDLTPATEQALQWVDSLFERSFVGTESRLFTAMSLLREIVHGAEEDAEARIARLQEERRELKRQIDRIRAGHIPVLDERGLRERFTNFSRTARELLADFRAVEHNFRELDRRVRERIAGWSDDKSSLLHSVFGEHDAITDSDEGRSFRAFWDFLMSPESQEELTGLLDQVYALEALGELREDPRLRRIHYDWMAAGEQTQRTVARLSQQLRRFLDDQAFFENKRIMQLLDSVTRHALALRESPPAGTVFHVAGSRAEIRLPMERPLYTGPAEVLLDTQEEDTQEIQIDTAALFEQEIVDMERLEGQISRELALADQVSLAVLVERYPLEQGLAELIAYFKLASEYPWGVVDEDHQSTIRWIDSSGVPRRARVPRVIFQRNRKETIDGNAP